MDPEGRKQADAAESMNRRQFLKWTGLGALGLFFAGCAEAVHPRATGIYPPGPIAPPPAVPPGYFTHVLAKGETLWGLSRRYGVSVDAILHANNFQNINAIPVGTPVAIPSAGLVVGDRLAQQVPLIPNKKWEYIIIHHSATDTGSVSSLDQLHRKRGFKSLGYHFVIGNGTDGLALGEVQPGPRWYRQEDGAHCSAGKMNHKGIGIVIVGNYSERRLHDRQLHSVAAVTRRLMDYYAIPRSRVLGHQHVDGARTECPGKQFPWRQFMRML